MLIYSIKYENGNVTKAPTTITIEVPDDECVSMIKADFQQRSEIADEKEKITRRSVQEIFDDLFNRTEYNQWHKQARHRGQVVKPFRREYETDDDTDGIENIPDFTDEENRERDYTYEALCQQIRSVLKPDYAEVLISVVLDEKMPEEFAAEKGLSRDAVYKRLQRAKNKFKKFYKTVQ